MNPTQNQDNNGPESHRSLTGAAADLIGLLTNPARFRALVARQVPQQVADLGDCFTITDAGREALLLPETAAGDGEEPVAFVAVRGWCEQCGRALPWKCTWQEPLCSNCVVVVPPDNPSSDTTTVPDTTASTAPADLVTETDGDTTAPVLRSAATYLERHGWIQGAYYDATSHVFTPAACMVGAIGMVCYGGPVDAPAQHFDDPGFLDFEATVLHLDRFLLVENSSESYKFNDRRGRTVAEVCDVLRKAAARPVHELIDALRVIDQHNADMAAMAEFFVPSGVFAAVPSRCPSCNSNWPGCRNVIEGDLGVFACCDDDWHDDAATYFGGVK